MQLLTAFHFRFNFIKPLGFHCFRLNYERFCRANEIFISGICLFCAMHNGFLQSNNVKYFGLHLFITFIYLINRKTQHSTDRPDTKRQARASIKFAEALSLRN